MLSPSEIADCANPVVTVLMSMRNAEKYVSKAVASILTQTFCNFEFLIIDDASTDNSLQIVEKFHDARIRLIKNSEQMGLSANLNRGIKLSRGEYIARMDADDISLPDRLAKQVAFMRSNPHVGVCGSRAIEINAVDKDLRVRKVKNGKSLEQWIWLPSPLIHPTVMFRKNIIENFEYDKTLPAAQDYELWLRLHSAGIRIDNLPTVLLRYRIHSENISNSKRTIQLEASYSAFKKAYPESDFTFEEFLSLIAQKQEMGPFRRHRNLQRMTGGRMFSIGMVKSFVRYTFFWMIQRLQTVTNRAAGQR